MKYKLLFLLLIQYGVIHSQAFKSLNLPSIEISEQLPTRLEQSSTLLNGKDVHNRPFKIQFYGQSIISGLNMERIEQKLNERFPGVNFEILKNSIGGYQAPVLRKTAHFDLYPEYPDLLIFHVYGGTKTGDLEEILCSIKSRLTSDVLIFDHHYSYEEDSIKQISRNIYQDKESQVLRDLTNKYGFGVIPVRKYWAEFLKLNPRYNIKDLLKDTIHPNDYGNQLLEYIILESLFKAVATNKDKNFPSPQEVIKIKSSNQIKIEFTGNKVVLKPDSILIGSTIDLMIDGKKPVAITELYRVTRPSSFSGQWWPAINKISLNSHVTPVNEVWKVKFYNIDVKNESYMFEVFADKSGYQGTGESGKDFTSANKEISFKHEDISIFRGPIKETSLVESTIEFEMKNPYINYLTVHDSEEITLLQFSSNESHILELNNSSGALLNSQLIIYQPQQLDCVNVN